MQVVYWLELQLTDSDVAKIAGTLKGAVHVRLACQTIVRTVLNEYPWKGRSDLLPIFDPGQNYEAGQIVALPVKDTQELRPDAWQFAKVKQVEDVENPVQGKFQVVTLDTNGKIEKYAARLTNPKPLKLKFPPADEEDFEHLVSYFGDGFISSLQGTVKELLESSRLKGQLVGDYVLLGKSSDFLDQDGLHSLTSMFANLSDNNPWLTTDDILDRLKEHDRLGDVTNQIAVIVLRGLLQEQGYVDLGGDRWTTQEIFERINRPVDRRLPVPYVSSKIVLPIQAVDKDAEAYDETKLSAEAKKVLQEWCEDTEQEKPRQPAEWRPMTSPIRLPTLTYLHITQAYFPLKGIGHAFHPDVRLVDIQVVGDDRLACLVDRQTGVLKAMDIEAFYEKFRLSNPPIPAGTYLWLEYQGGVNYCIAPRPLPRPCTMTCKNAYMKDGELVIEQVPMEMEFEGDPQRFMADLRFDEIEALYEEARRVNQSIRDITIETVQELSRLDPEGRTHYNYIFNAVFLKRMCSPNSVIGQLYNQPCFIQLKNGYFRFDESKEMMSTAVAVPSTVKMVKPLQPTPVISTVEAGMDAVPLRELPKEPAKAQPVATVVSPFSTPPSPPTPKSVKLIKPTIEPPSVASVATEPPKAEESPALVRPSRRWWSVLRRLWSFLARVFRP